jgi:hypothetical protein
VVIKILKEDIVMKERDTLEGIKNRYRRQIEELRQKRHEIDVELGNLESYASTLQEIQAREDGSDVPENVARIGGTLSLVKPCVTAKQLVPEERGWLKKQCILYVETVAVGKFGGGEVARWFRSQGYRLMPYQYNQIFLIMRDLAKENKLVYRVGSSYQKTR